MYMYLKWTTSKDLLFSTRNSAQCFYDDLKGKEILKAGIYVHVWLILFAIQ